MELKNKQLQKYVSLSIGILGSLFGGIVLGFNAYAIALKQTFNYTQTELDYIASFGDVGLSFPFPAGIVIDSFGPRVTCTISLILTTTGFTLMWMTTKFRIFYSSKSWCLCVFYFVASNGAIFIIAASKVVNCRNFDKKHMGKIFGLFGASFGMSPAIFSAIYAGLFVQGHIDDPENQKLGEFMLMLAVLSACINIYGVIMLKTIPEGINEDEIKLSILSKTNQVKAKSATKDNQSNVPMEDEKATSDRTALVAKSTTRPPLWEDLKCWQIIKTNRFYYIFLICIIIGGTGGSFTNNITIVVQSAQIGIEELTFTVMIPICASVGRFLGGAVPDIIFQKWPDVPKSSVLLFAGIMSCVGQLVFTFFNQSLAGLICASVMMALAYGSLYTQLNMLAIEYFGLKYYGQNYGVIVVGHGIGIILFQKLFALNYETYSQSGSKSCFGKYCTFWYFVLMTVLCFCAVFLIFCLMKIERDRRLQREKELQDA